MQQKTWPNKKLNTKAGEMKIVQICHPSMGNFHPKKPQVSIAICNLHGLAEGARFTLLYVDYMSGDSRILVPIISGVLWNVLLRIGCMDRLLHVISCKYGLRPNNSSKLLRESGRRCVGGQ